MEIKKIFSKVLATSLLATTLISSSAMSTSAVNYDRDGYGAQSGTWSYSPGTINAYVGGSIRITDLGTFSPYQIGYNVVLSGKDKDTAAAAVADSTYCVFGVRYKVYEKDVKSKNILKDSSVYYKTRGYSVSATTKEYGCDDKAILQLQYNVDKVRYLRSKC
jgi:hypothetical protein